MFNPKQFENRVYTLVTKEVNKAFSALLKKDNSVIELEGIKMQKQVMKALHCVVQETAIQILYGLLVRMRQLPKARNLSSDENP
jgi:hypothetical protein